MLARIINPLFPKSVNWKIFATKIAKIVKIDRLIEVKFVIPPLSKTWLTATNIFKFLFFEMHMFFYFKLGILMIFES